jgi:hypothetical protein
MRARRRQRRRRRHPRHIVPYDRFRLQEISGFERRREKGKQDQKTKDVDVNFRLDFP